MAKCKACGAEVSRTAKVCPICKARILHPAAGAAAAIICIAFVLGVMYVTSSGGGHSARLAGPGISDAPAPTGSALPSIPAGTSPSEIEATGILLGPGTYVVGQDIPAGTYDCVAASGMGVLRGEIASFGDPGFLQTMGVDSDYFDCVNSYSNLTLTEGDTLSIEMSLYVDFQ